MSLSPVPIARVSSQLSGSLLLGTLQSAQLNLLQVQQQLSTGNRLSRASDDPAAALGIESLKRQIATNNNYTSNLGIVSGFLSQTDSTLGSVADLINQAKSIASSQLGAGSTPDERASQAEVVNSLLAQAMDLANTKYQNQSIFGGQNGTQAAFASVGGGYKYQGTNTQLGILTPTGGTLNYTLSGDAAFGAVSSQVVGYQNLTPAVSATTRLADLNGATLKGVQPGSVKLTIGATSSTVDLSQANTVGDVVNTLNAAFTAAGSNATATVTSSGIHITGDSTNAVTIADAQSGTTAASLGISGFATAGGAFSGAALSPKLTDTTPLTALNNGLGIDPSGLIISNGSNTATISLSGLGTVQDLLNAINNSGTNVRAEINANGSGINVLNPLSGSPLTIGENGGATANQLGIRSLNAQTSLADFNNGNGVTPIANSMGGASGKIVITKTDGTQFSVQVDGIKTPTQLIAAINGATGNGTVTATLNSGGNGISLSDSTPGAGNISVATAPNYISNGTDFGIFKTGAGSTLTGTNITLATDDFRITRRDGTNFTVSLSGATTVQDVLNRINTADGNVSGTHVTATLNTTGNGISLTDPSAGGGALTVTAVNGSEAASQLGILKTASGPTPGVITGDDNNPLQPQGLFSTLTLLRDSLLKNDNNGIAQAAALLDTDGARAIKARGIVGAHEQDISGRQTDVSGQQTQLKQALSLLNDTDFAAAATKLQQLQTAYQASLQVAQTTNNLSLLDFLK